MPDFQDHTIASNYNADEHSGGSAFSPGNILAGKYKVLSLLGRGGMGIVYKVQQVFLNQELALKVLDSRQVTNDQQMRRFQLEGKASYSLNHENLVRVHDFGLLENHQPYLVMDLVDGTTLADCIKTDGPLPVQKAIPIFIQASLALAYAHQRSIIHRDIKPSNIMLINGSDADVPTVKIVDFGIAKIGSDQKGEIQALTRTGEVFGSPLYMSPEQCSGELIDSRTDIYSLGCTLFEALTGTPPHVGNNALRTMMLHQSAEAPTLKEASMGKQFPNALEQIVQKMISKSTAERYRNFEDVARDLSAVNSGRAPAAGPARRKAGSNKNYRSRLSLQALIASLIGTVLLTVLTCTNFLGRLSQKKVVEQTAPPVKIAGPQLAEDRSIGKNLDDVAIKTQTKLSDARKSFSAAKAIESKVVLNDNNVAQRQFTFPEAPLGAIRCSHFLEPQKPAQLASSVRYVPADAFVILEVGGVNPESFKIPSVFKKIGRNEFNGLKVSAPDSQYSEESTAPGRETEEGNYLADICTEVTKWTKLEELGIHGIVLNKISLDALEKMKHLKVLSISGLHGSELDLAQRGEFLKRLKIVWLGKLSATDTLKALTGSQNLQYLVLFDTTDVPGTDLKMLSTCKNLRYITIKTNAIDDSTIDSLCAAKSLLVIFFQDSSINPWQLKRLLKSLPKLKQIYLSRKSLDHLDLELMHNPKILHYTEAETVQSFE